MKNIQYIRKLPALALLLISFGFPSFACAEAPEGAQFSIPMTANAWNLISVPFDLPDENVAAVLGDSTNSIDTIYMYDSDNWFVYHTKHPELSTLKTIQPGYGYFIHTTAPTTLHWRGTSFLASSTPAVRHLESGWNLVGVFAQTADQSHDIDEVFSSIGFSGVDYLALWGLDPITQSFTTPESADIGNAFWILLNTPHVYGPSNF